MSPLRSIVLLLAAGALGACTLSFDLPSSPGPRDLGVREGGVDDTSVGDGGRDAGPLVPGDSGAMDAGPIDTGCSDGVVACVEGAEMRCSGGRIVEASCDYGCAPGGARCGTLVPSNVPSLPLEPGLAPIVLEGESSIDTDDCSGRVAVLEGGGEACVLAGGSLVVATDAVVVVRGTRPLVLLIGGDATIDGVLDASASNDVPGPSGADSGEPDDIRSGGAGRSSALFVAGGGGGGGCGAAGAGGSSGTSLGGTAGSSDAMFPRPLAGGGAGGSGGENNGGFGGRGGAGGGAIQITALGSVIVRGAILASGAGGRGGRIGGGLGAGGGGGAGGVVWLEARAIEIAATAAVLAGGGGGGGGGFGVAGGTGNGGAGIDGSESSDPAEGGTSASASDMAGEGGRAGGGSALDAEPGFAGFAASPLGPAAGGGGGGGGAGCVYLLSGSGSATTPGAISPTAAGGFLAGRVTTE